jgi:diacylglycerol O-acyltransferase
MVVIMPICSYNGTISISPTSAVNLTPDLDDFTRYMRESANELEEAAHQKTQEIAALKKFLEQNQLIF